MYDTKMIERYVQNQLKIKHLRMLVQIADEGKLTQVAKLMNLSQPAASKMLSEIEAGFGTPLFEKDGRGIKPTAHGSVLIRYAREMLLSISKANEEIKSLSLGVNGRVKVGILVGLATHVLLAALAEMKAKWPLVTISIYEATHKQNIANLQSGCIDLLIGRTYLDPEHNNLEVEVLYEEPLVLVASREHPLSQKSDVIWKDLEDIAWILPFEESPTCQRLMSLLAQNNIRKPKDVLECVTRNITIPVLSSGQRVGMLPFSDARQYASQGLLSILPIDLGSVPAPMGMIWSRAHRPSRELELFQQQIRLATTNFLTELNVSSYPKSKFSL